MENLKECKYFKRMKIFFFKFYKAHDLLIANPTRLLEIINENQNLINLSHVSFLIVDEYIQFRKSQTMDFVKDIVEYLKV